jgi:Na+-transporting NADH:ubiquinone oxidoreductase subunit NqrB
MHKITLYRLTLYVLIFLVLVALILSWAGVLPFSALNLFVSVLFLVGVSLIVNYIFAETFGAPYKVESVLITALILALIISPIKNFGGLWFLFWAATLAVGSKFILSINKRHIFNPAALAVAVTAIFANLSASWWVGTLAMLPFVLVGGALIIYKSKRFNMVYYFLFFAVVTTLTFSAFKGTDIIMTARKLVADSALLFFAFIMLTEPLTMPLKQGWQVVFAVIVGFLIAPQVHLGSFYFTPEVALLTGNVLAYLTKIRRKPQKALGSAII